MVRESCAVGAHQAKALQGSYRSNHEPISAILDMSQSCVILPQICTEWVTGRCRYFTVYRECVVTMLVFRYKDNSEPEANSNVSI